MKFYLVLLLAGKDPVLAEYDDDFTTAIFFTKKKAKEFSKQISIRTKILKVKLEV